MSAIEVLDHIIKTRRSIFPAQYIEKEISEEIIQQILENANWAPNHRKTEPWRFIIYKGMGLQKLSASLASAYKAKFVGEAYSELKYKKTKQKPLQCATVIAICMKRDEKGSLPEWEEIAAVSCAVQNMWLSCSARGIGCYWSTPNIVIGRNSFMDLEEGVRCLGLFYMGYWDTKELPASRGKIANKIRWVNQ